MNKFAAEKIAQKYYALGQQMALGNTTKTASSLSRIARGATGVTGAGLGALAIPTAAHKAGTGIAADAARGLENFLEYVPMANNQAQALALMAPMALGGGILGAKAMTTGYDALARLPSETRAAIIKKMVQAPVAGLGAILGTNALAHLPGGGLGGIPGELLNYSALGGGAMLGAKGVDLAHTGLKKLRR